MLFDSYEFFIFLSVVFVIYWSLQKHVNFQNFLILISSYFFYAWWDWRYLFLILTNSLIDYVAGLNIQNKSKKKNKKIWLFISLSTNIGMLCIFKYMDFFSQSFADLVSLIGFATDPILLNLVLPVGISFYTFQTMSYSIDIYKGNLKASNNLIEYLAYVSFFPQLVAGPIERATNLLPQFSQKRTFSYDKATDGLKQILWGLFKKVVIADNCAIYVNYIFENFNELSGFVLLLGGILFAFQIYGDFSGYSDIAIGTSKLFGFSLMQNFAFPYFSRDIAEFWRRWHISLSTWFRDYLYIPLGGSKGGVSMKIRNTFAIFLVSGFWHGANWTYLAWGALNAFYFLPLLLYNKNRRYLSVVAEGRIFPSLKEFFQIAITFLLTVIAWIFFRAESITIAINYISLMGESLISGSFFYLPDYFVLRQKDKLNALFIFLLLITEWVNRSNQHGLQAIFQKAFLPIRWAFYLLIALIIGNFGVVEEIPFIYFQF